MLEMVSAASTHRALICCLCVARYESWADCSNSDAASLACLPMGTLRRHACTTAKHPLDCSKPDAAVHGPRRAPACRNTAQARLINSEVRKEARGGREPGNVEAFYLDLADLHSVAQFAEELKGRVQRIDILCANAGELITCLRPGLLCASSSVHCCMRDSDHLAEYSTARLAPSGLHPPPDVSCSTQQLPTH